MVAQELSKWKPHRFGGSWTEAKLEILRDYLGAYTTALKKTPFRLGYIDAFAGSGYRVGNRPDLEEPALFPDLAEPEPLKLLDGSASIALKTEPPFHGFVFIERDAERCQELEAFREEFPEKADRIQIRHGDANAEIQRLCRGVNWSLRRAVLFLDPYGMQVEWETIEAIAATGAIDLWLLFPLGIGVNRLLVRSGEIPKAWQERLTKLLGTNDWYEDFYQFQQNPQGSLFEEIEDEELVSKASTEVIGGYFVDRLRDVFAGVVEEPGVLRNSTNCPLYLLCFAAANKRGAKVACGIANDLLERIR